MPFCKKSDISAVSGPRSISFGLSVDRRHQLRLGLAMERPWSLRTEGKAITARKGEFEERGGGNLRTGVVLLAASGVRNREKVSAESAKTRKTLKRVQTRSARMSL
jgi:hypothetical protein